MNNWYHNIDVVYSKSKKDIKKFRKIFIDCLNFYSNIKFNNYYNCGEFLNLDLILTLKSKIKKDEKENAEDMRGFIVFHNDFILKNKDYYYFKFASKTATKSFFVLEQVLKTLNKEGYFKNIKHCTFTEKKGSDIFLNSDLTGLFFKNKIRIITDIDFLQNLKGFYEDEKITFVDLKRNIEKNCYNEKEKKFFLNNDFETLLLKLKKYGSLNGNYFKICYCEKTQ